VGFRRASCVSTPWMNSSLVAHNFFSFLRDEVYVFVQKKIKRGFLKKHLMHAADDEKVVTTRDTLRKWTTKLEVRAYRFS